MAVNDTDLERDPALARLMQAASGEQPPASLDAAILAAARREVGARPAVVGGGGQTSIPPVRAKRNWYVPVSIAAVMVLSVSLVLTMHHEKGDELSQPPMATAPVPKATAPAAAPAAEPAAAPAENADAMLRDAAPAHPKLDEAKRAEPAKTAEAVAKPESKPEAYGELAKKQRMEKPEAAADSAVTLGNSSRKDQAAGSAVREQGAARDSAAEAKSAPGAVTGGAAGPSASQDRAPVEARREAEASGRQAQERPRGTIGIRGFDGSSMDGTSVAPNGVAAPQPSPPVVREAKPAPEQFPAQSPASREEALARSEADRRTNTTRGTTPEAPAASAPVAPPAAVAAPQAKVLAAPRRAVPTDDGLTQSAPAQAEGRLMSTPPPVKPAPPPAPKPAVRPPVQKPAPVWRGLEDQPPEKWLERLAEFRRDNRPTDADELLTEFRRRFPDHPASAR